MGRVPAVRGDPDRSAVWPPLSPAPRGRGGGVGSRDRRSQRTGESAARLAGRPAPYLIHRAMEAAGATSVHRVMNGGDTELDLRAGWNAGVAWNVGVTSGAHDRERLERAPHTHLLDSVEHLPSLW